MAKHPSHTTQVPRINRAVGQLEAVKRMVGEESYCVDIISQLRAARNAIKAIELSVLETHIGGCVAAACASKDPALKDTRIREIMTLLKKYE